MKYKENWKETKERFTAWWRRENADRPLMRIEARRKELLEPLETIESPKKAEELYLDVKRLIKEKRNYLKSHKMMAEAYPYIDLNIGPGSLALYLGSEPIFAWDTVWFKKCVKDWKDFGELKFNPENYWWKTHVDMIRKAQEEAKGEFLVSIPDLIENVDILSAMRDPQEFCYDLIDEPELMKSYVNQVDDLYFKYYDALYDIVKEKDGSSSFTAFSIWGQGKTAKVQCDFCALMSPSQFREFVQPSLRKQCERLDNSLYHLDGPDAIKHLDALMEIESLDAVQWTSGAGKPDGASELWYPVYDKVRDASKGLWISIYDGDYDNWVQGAEKLVKRYGSKGLYLLFPEMEEEQAERLLIKAEKEWK
jgi:hypothetical protein